MTEAQIVLRMSRSQQMALLDVLMEHMRCPDHTEIFLDCSSDPPTDTRYGDLLTLCSDTSEVKL